MKETKEMRSLNTELPTFYMEELEQRLETDPIAVNGLLAQASNIDIDSASRISCDHYCDIHCGDDCSDYCGEYCQHYCQKNR